MNPSDIPDTLLETTFSSFMAALSPDQQRGLTLLTLKLIAAERQTQISDPLALQVLTKLEGRLLPYLNPLHISPAILWKTPN